MESRIEKAVELFKSGYNCAQAVFVTYADLYDIDKETALKLSSSFGGGIGGMREVCGAVCGMCMIVGLESGMTIAKDSKQKQENYALVQELAEKFRKENGSILCKQLLGLEPGIDAGKKKKPCVEYVRYCAELIEQMRPVSH